MSHAGWPPALKFPDEDVIALDLQEWRCLRSKVSTLNNFGRERHVPQRDRLSRAAKAVENEKGGCLRGPLFCPETEMVQVR